jgi:hypothetical protein
MVVRSNRGRRDMRSSAEDPLQLIVLGPQLGTYLLGILAPFIQRAGFRLDVNNARKAAGICYA